jgi:hypothetical protein
MHSNKIRRDCNLTEWSELHTATEMLILMLLAFLLPAGHRLHPLEHPSAASQANFFLSQPPLGASPVDFGDFIAPHAPPGPQMTAATQFSPSVPPEQALSGAPELPFARAGAGMPSVQPEPAPPAAENIFSSRWEQHSAAPHKRLEAAVPSTKLGGVPPAVHAQVESPVSDGFGDFASAASPPALTATSLPGGLTPTSHGVLDATLPTLKLDSPLCRQQLSVQDGPTAGAVVEAPLNGDEDDGFGTFAEAEEDSTGVTVEVTVGGIREGPLSLDVFGEEDHELQNAPISWEALRQAAADADVAASKTSTVLEDTQATGKEVEGGGCDGGPSTTGKRLFSCSHPSTYCILKGRNDNLTRWQLCPEII